MKKILIPLLFIATFSFAQSTETFHNFMVMKINGDTLHLSDLAGKKILVVNTASYCFYTPQYANLEQLYTLYGGPAFEIIGFPCNDFGSQEPGDEATIDSFVTQNYNITFPMMHKVDIISADTAEVYKWLQLFSRNGVANAPVTWNFHKFLIDEAGHWIRHYPSQTDPLDTAIVNWILSPDISGISKEQNNFFVNLISNPVKDFIDLRIETNRSIEMKIKLFDVKGQYIADIFSGRANQIASVTFPVSHLENGIYFLTVASDSGTKSYKIVVLK